MRALERVSWVMAALAAPALANSSQGTTFPMTVHQSLTAKDACPSACPVTTGLQPGDWSALRSLEELEKCNETIIFSTSVRFPLVSDERPTYLQACTVPSGFVSSKANSPPCVAAKSNQTATKVDFHVGWSEGDGSKASLTQVVTAAAQLEHAAASDTGCGATILFAKSGSAVLGLYAGAEVDRTSVSRIMQEYMDYTQKRDTAVPAKMAFQLCGNSHNDAFKSAAHIVGVYASTTGDVEAVHKALSQWTEAKCVTGLDSQDTVSGKKVTFLAGDAVTAASRKGTRSLALRSLQKRAECSKYVMVKSGDTCQALAGRCGISMDAFVHFNGNGDNSFCSTLQIDTPMCCTAGDKPDLRPTNNADGTCAVYSVQADDLCYNINQKYHLKDDDLDKFNVGKTWGWSGCKKLIPGQKVCLSDGTPPMPVWVKNAVCGPQKPGTKQDGDKKLSDYNYCQINACCDIWGQCGTTEEFCTDTTIDHTLGTAANGTNGCISNCGTDIQNNDKAPSSYSQVAYFEAWNYERKCLHMDVSAIRKPYTHIHFAFGDISDGDWKISAKGVEEQFKSFVGMRRIKRIMSLGGWAFSNEGTTNHIMRDAVKPENREAFAKNVISFVKEYGLDGIDFDWEYPGADDIPGADPGTPEDGPNYLEFLKLVRAGLGDKSISIATPASFWYLRHFPIKELADVVDYTVFMTYDFHGQWDVDNKYVSPGCPQGNCLRSHINSTETQNALSMITKAGMPTNKIMVGVSSYGRSFKMAKAGCYGPECTYLGGRNQSPAKHGKCTDTGGYIADAEIEAILKDKSRVTKKYWDVASDTDVLIYDDVEWVAYMTNTTKERRRDDYKKLNFAGTSDWAVDLQGDSLDNNGGGEIVYIGTDVYTSPTMHLPTPCTVVFAPSHLSSASTITPSPWVTSLSAVFSTYTVTVTPDPITITEVPFYNVPVPTGQSSPTPIQPYPSISIPDATVTFTYTTGSATSTSTRIIGMPPWPAYLSGAPADGTDWDLPPNITSSSDSTGFFAWPTNTDPPPAPPPVSTTTHTPTWGWETVFGSMEALPTAPPEIECENNCDEDDNDNSLITFDLPCHVWFFNTCPNGGGGGGGGGFGGGGGGWRIRLPRGHIGPGPPPPGFIDLPDGFHIEGDLPSWPVIDVEPGKTPEEPDEPDECKTESASICGTTTSYGSSIAPGGATKTTTSSVYSTCYTIYGCDVEDDDSTTTTGGSCKAAARRRALPTASYAGSDGVVAPRSAAAAVTTGLGSFSSPMADQATTLVKKHVIEEQVVQLGASQDEEVDHESIHARAPSEPLCVFIDVLVVPKDIHNVQNIDAYLADRVADGTLKDYKPAIGFKGTPNQYTAWYFIADFPVQLIDQFESDVPQIAAIYDPDDFAEENECVKYADSFAIKNNKVLSEPEANLTRRDGIISTSGDYANAMMSQPRGQRTLYDKTSFYEDGSYHYHLDDSAGAGQTIYMIESGLQSGYAQQAEFQGAHVVFPIVLQNVYPEIREGNGADESQDHGSQVLSVLVGQTIGTAKKATVVPVLTYMDPTTPWFFPIFEGLMAAMDDIVKTDAMATSIINLSASVLESCLPDEVKSVIEAILTKIESYNILLVVSAGNNRATPDGSLQTSDGTYPAKIVERMPCGIVAGNIDRHGVVADASSRHSVDSNKYQVFAEGAYVQTYDRTGQLVISTGTSLSAPRIAALGAYLRGVNSDYQGALQSGSKLKDMIVALADTLYPQDVPDYFAVQFPKQPTWAPKHVWNGQVPPDPNVPGSKSKSCLQERDGIEFGAECNVCPDLSHILAAEARNKAPIQKRLAACHAPGHGGNGGSGGSGGEAGGIEVPGPVSWSEGDPSPTCASDCGEVCQGFFCSPRPTGTNPDFDDPDHPPRPSWNISGKEYCPKYDVSPTQFELRDAYFDFCGQLRAEYPDGTFWEDQSFSRNISIPNHIIVEYEFTVKPGCDGSPIAWGDCINVNERLIQDCGHGGIIENECFRAREEPFLDTSHGPVQWSFDNAEPSCPSYAVTPTKEELRADSEDFCTKFTDENPDGTYWEDKSFSRNYNVDEHMRLEFEYTVKAHCGAKMYHNNCTDIMDKIVSTCDGLAVSGDHDVRGGTAENECFKGRAEPIVQGD